MQRASTAAPGGFQSTPAIAGGRCPADRSFSPRVSSFNPRPPLLAGDALGWGNSEAVIAVSIHARHCWRAMLARQALKAPVLLFQSTPAIAGGRCQSPGGCRCTGFGFNPRPPLLAGDAPQITVSCHIERVSIHARHCWRAMLRLRRVARCSERVSIHARHCWRAMPGMSGQRGRTEVFQSTPAIAGGRCDC